MNANARFYGDRGVIAGRGRRGALSSFTVGLLNEWIAVVVTL